MAPLFGHSLIINSGLKTTVLNNLTNFSHQETSELIQQLLYFNVEALTSLI